MSINTKNSAGNTALSDIYDRVYIQTGKLFASECHHLDECIALSFSAYTDLAKHAKLDEKRDYLLAFFYRNCVYLSAAYHLVRSGMLDPAGNNMRTVFETIIWQYAYLYDDSIYFNFKEITEMESEKLHMISDKTWSNTKERELENLRRKYNFQKMTKSLYSKKTFEKFFFNQYWMLCQKSHSSIFGINYNTPNMEGTTTLEKGPEELRGNLSALLYLSVENLICFLNCFSHQMGQDKIDHILGAINKTSRTIPPALTLAPDTKKLDFVSRFTQL